MRIGIDLGGTKIEGLVLGPGGEELARGRIEPPQGNNKGDYEATLAAIAGLGGKLARDAGAGGDLPAGLGDGWDIGQDRHRVLWVRLGP